MTPQLSLFVGTSIVLAAQFACSAAPEDCPKPLDTARALTILQSSKDRPYLEKVALFLVHSKDPTALDKLAPFLRDPKFLSRLDADEDYDSTSRTGPRISTIISAIGKLDVTKAQDILLQLIADKKFIAQHERLRAVILACGSIRKPSTKLLTFLDSMADDTDSSNYHLAIRSLIYTRSPEASKLVEKRFLSPDYSASAKIAWLNMVMVFVRDDPVILALYERLLRADVKDADVRQMLVLTLFDFQPHQWLGLLYNKNFVPPPRQDAPTEVLQKLRELADVALKLDIPAATKTAVEKARKDIDDILAKREKK